MSDIHMMILTSVRSGGGGSGVDRSTRRCEKDSLEGGESTNLLIPCAP